MADGIFKQGLRKARSMRPSQIRRQALQPFHLDIVGSSAPEREALVRLFVPSHVTGEARTRALSHLEPRRHAPTLTVLTPSVAARPLAAPLPPEPITVIDPGEPGPGFLSLLRAHPDLRLALARVFPVLREPLAGEMIRAVAARNAAIAAISALPEVIPNPLSVLLAIGEMGSDTVLITANQVELCFHLAALRDDEVGWLAQSRALTAILGASVGWRALARELVGWIPAGIGVAAKASVAYTGTMVVGQALWRLPQRAAGEVKRVPGASTQRRGVTLPRLASRRQTA